MGIYNHQNWLLNFLKRLFDLNGYNKISELKRCPKSKNICLEKLNLKNLRVKMEAQLIWVMAVMKLIRNSRPKMDKSLNSLTNKLMIGLNGQ